MKDSLYDRLLIGLAVAGPLVMVALNAWQASLTKWYVPFDSDSRGAFGTQFERNVSDWVASTHGTGAELVVIVDRSCPCTKATLLKLNEAVARSQRKDVRVVVRDIHDTDTETNTAWQKMLPDIPATPTLLTIEGKQLVYAGPAISGSFCTSAVQRVLGISVLQAPPRSPLFNWVDKGCYCPTTRA